MLVVRAGLIVGPYDPTGRFTYWVHRIARGGDFLVPSRTRPAGPVRPRPRPADWISLAEQRRAGIFNATGPAEPLTMEMLIDVIREATESDAKPIWMDEATLVEQGVEAWSDLPLWLAPGANPESAGFLSVDISRAVAAGLRFRPLDETIRDTLERADTSPEAGLQPDRERELLGL